MATKKRNTSKIVVTLVMPTTELHRLGKAAHAMELAHEKKKGDHYKRDMRALSADLATGRDDIAVAELKRRKAEYSKGCGYKDAAEWNSSAERKGLERAAKAIGFKAPTAEKEPTSEDEKKKIANKKAQERSRARKAIIAAKPTRKFKNGELDELVTEKVKELHATQTAQGREITKLAAWCKKINALSLELPEIASANVSEVQLRLAAVVAEVVAITPKQ